mmetsp:Transcript_15226/g.21717  ORF Transcript_15226/g.21717 Transcript_15226/m.21717 type:complete len:204 (-) Transcript_15226:1673-2284(-)
MEEERFFEMVEEPIRSTVAVGKNLAAAAKPSVVGIPLLQVVACVLVPPTAAFVLALLPVAVVLAPLVAAVDGTLPRRVASFFPALPTVVGVLVLPAVVACALAPPTAAFVCALVLLAAVACVLAPLAAAVVCDLVLLAAVACALAPLAAAAVCALAPPAAVGGVLALPAAVVVDDLAAPQAVVSAARLLRTDAQLQQKFAAVL